MHRKTGATPTDRSRLVRPERLERLTRQAKESSGRLAVKDRQLHRLLALAGAGGSY